MDYSAISSVYKNQIYTAAATAATNQSTGQLDSEFSQLLFSLMAILDRSSDSDSGLGLSMLMMPVMMNLLERMQSNQLYQQVSQSTQQLQANPSGMPAAGRLTQGYHASHHGLDFGMKVGTPIQTTMAGKVVYAGWNNEGYGNLVIVENGPYSTYYGHLSSIPVSVGDWVSNGEVIGLSGNTGNSTGPHLHYEVRLNGKTIDPTSITLNKPVSASADRV